MKSAQFRNISNQALPVLRSSSSRHRSSQQALSPRLLDSSKIWATPSQRNFSLRAVPRVVNPASSSSSSMRWYSTASGTEESASSSESSTTTPPPSDKKSSETKSSKDKQEGNNSEADEKDKEIARLKDSLLRAMADYKNLQTITARDKSSARDFAITSFARDLISSIDILSLALSSIQESKRTDRQANPDLVNLYEGVQLTKNDLEKVLARHGVVGFNPIGEKFDPNKHEAMYQAPIPDKEPGTVAECQKIGYTIKERLLRPAQVGVVLEKS